MHPGNSDIYDITAEARRHIERKGIV